MAQIWSEVLGVKTVGIHDGFLDLGGDSLLASQVVTRVIAKMSVALPLVRLFAAPTVADMAAEISDALIHNASEEVIEQLLAELDAGPSEMIDA
ncbi:MAG: hypothetical protein HC802_02065 [Caldilineaceae bacterium]|nr:hypothetical protein [Caldilineaceae bacterium]